MSCKSCEQNKNIFEVAVNVAKGIYNNIAPTEETNALLEQRLKICKNCIYIIELVRINNKSVYQCNECKCLLNLKATIKEESCPKGYW